MPPLEIVAADQADRRWAAELMAGSDPWITLGRGLDRCLAACCDPEHLVFIARHDGERHGVIILQSRGVAGSPYVVSLASAPDARGAGVGSRLLTFAETLMCREATYLFLCVSSFNERARRFYERYGFEQVGRYDFMVGSHADEDIVLRHVVMQADR